ALAASTSSCVYPFSPPTPSSTIALFAALLTKLLAFTTWVYSQIHEYSEAVAGSIPLSQLYTKSCAVRGEPSDQLDFLRWNVTVSPSADVSQRSAIPGCTTPLFSRLRPSNVWLITSPPSLAPLRPGSIVFGS